LRSTPSDSLEPVSVFDGSLCSSSGRFAGRPFRLRGCGRRGLCAQLGRASNWRPLFVYGYSQQGHQLGCPLLISSTVAPESLFERLRSSGGCIFMVEFPWGRASDPAGVALEPLEEFFTPSRVIMPNLWKSTRCPSWKALIDSFYAGGLDVLPVERASFSPD